MNTDDNQPIKQNPQTQKDVWLSFLKKYYPVIIILIVGIGLVAVWTYTKKDTGTEIADPYENWQTYRNEEYGFEIKYPKGTKIKERTGLWENKYNYTDINFLLPFTAETKLKDKGLRILVRKNTTSNYCFDLINWKEIININGIEFHHTPGFKWDYAMGGKQFFAENYALFKNNNCFTLEFRLQITNPEGFVDSSFPIPPYPPEKDLDVTIFDKILSTFKFIEEEAPL